MDNGTHSRLQRRAMSIIMLCTFFTSLGQLFWKAGVVRIDLSQFTTLFNVPFLLGIVAYGIGTILMLVAFRKGELSILSPIFATSYVWVSLFSPFFYPTDSMNLWKWVGVLTILLSVALLSRSVSPQAREVKAYD